MLGLSVEKRAVSRAWMQAAESRASASASQHSSIVDHNDTAVYSHTDRQSPTVCNACCLTQTDWQTDRLAACVLLLRWHSPEGLSFIPLELTQDWSLQRRSITTVSSEQWGSVVVSEWVTYDVVCPVVVKLWSLTAYNDNVVHLIHARLQSDLRLIRQLELTHRL